MGWAKSMAMGLAFGLITSVTPIELFGFVPILLALYGWRRARKDGPRKALLFASSFAVIVTTAVLLPLGPADREHVSRPLDAPCVSIERATEAARWRTDALSEALRQRRICFASLQPSLGELRSALEAEGIEVDPSRCANGATLLFGGYWITARLKHRAP